MCHTDEEPRQEKGSDMQPLPGTAETILWQLETKLKACLCKSIVQRALSNFVKTLLAINKTVQLKYMCSKKRVEAHVLKYQGGTCSLKS